MKKMSSYKGYTATVEFDPDEMLLHGRVDNIRDVVTFHAESVGDVQDAFQEALDDYLDLCSERGEEPDRPYSGRFVVRLDPDLHRQATSAAERCRVSLNAWVIQAVQRSLHENQSSGRMGLKPKRVAVREGERAVASTNSKLAKAAPSARGDR